MLSDSGARQNSSKPPGLTEYFCDWNARIVILFGRFIVGTWLFFLDSESIDQIARCPTDTRIIAYF